MQSGPLLAEGIVGKSNGPDCIEPDDPFTHAVHDMGVKVAYRENFLVLSLEFLMVLLHVLDDCVAVTIFEKDNILNFSDYRFSRCLAHRYMQRHFPERRKFFH